MSEENYSQEELNAFSEKLDRWGGTLPTRERALLQALVAEASQFAEGHEEDEVQGFGFNLEASQIPTLESLAGSALQPIIQMPNSWQLRAFDRWDPTK